MLRLFGRSRADQGAASCRRRHRVKRRSRQLECLEHRHLLAVVISEFMAANETTLADEDGEFPDWVELHNTGPQEIELADWYLTDDSGDLDRWRFPAVRLQAGEYRVVFASGKDRRPTSGPLHTNFKLDADGEYLALVQPDGVTVEFAYAAEFPPQAADVSYGLSSDGLERGFFPQPSPGGANPGAPITDPSRSVVISEIMYSLPRDGILDREATEEEFIELHNRGLAPIDVQGWQFTRGVQFTLPAVSIPPNGYLVVAADAATFASKYPQVTRFVAGWQGSLSNSGETLELVDDFGHLVDRVRYADEGDWSTREVGPNDRGHRGWIWSVGHDGGNKSLELIQRNHTNDVGQNWGASLPDGGTPGSTNSIAAADIAPLIRDVTHTPAIPHSSAPVTITAQLWDEQSTGMTAQVRWRLEGEAGFRTLTMFDDGQHDDANQSDGIYAAQIPPHPDRSIIEYYVQARDALGNQRTWPAPTASGNQETNALYQVLDDLPSLEPGDPPIYVQVMTGVERAEFTAIDRLSDAQFNATFIAVTGTGTDVRHNTGIRIRGSASRDAAVPNNRIRIPSDRPWRGMTRINVNSVNPVNQVAGSALFRLAGLPASDVHAVRMISNGVDLRGGGFYVHSEPLDGQFAENHFPLDDDGNIYRGRRSNESPRGGRGAGLVYYGTDPAPYVSYVKNTNASEADWSDVIDLTFALNEVNDGAFVDAVQQVVDVDQWFRAMAMNSLIDNNEFGLFTGDPQGDDYAMYRGVDDPRFRFIPYDWDTLFGNVNRDIFRPVRVPALNRLINHPEFLPRYYGQFIDLIDNVIVSDALDATLQQALGAITGANRIAQIRQFLTNRATAVRALINEQLTVDTGLEVSHGLPRSTVPSLSLSGTAPVVNTRSVTVDGKLVDRLDGQGRWSMVANSNEARLIPAGSDWSYLDDGSDQGTAWRQRAFDAANWPVGATQLGYGDGDETTTIGFGDSADDKHITSYFRRTFQIDNPASISQLTLSLLFDDGAAVYINGVPAARFNLDDDAGYQTLAQSFRARPDEAEFETAQMSAPVLASLVAGTNVIAVEVHQAAADSSDLSFDLELTAVLAGPGVESDLFPGINRLTVAAYDDKDGMGRLIASREVDVWYDTGNRQQVSDVIASDTTWRASEGPYVISGNVTLQSNATLSIEPGTTVFFDEGARLTVRGRLQAIGLPDRSIRFTRLPGTSRWDGIQWVDSMRDNRIEHAILEYGVTDDGMIGLENSQLALNHVTLDQTTRRRIRSIDSSLIVTNSTFTNIADPDEAPATDNRSEHIWGRGIPENGQWILDGNTFGHTTGHNDAIDFDAPRLPGPIPWIRNNLFVGGGDDALDMTGDVFVEGNTFRAFIKDRFNTDPGESNTISASSGEFWVVRNVFDNVHHAALVKEDAFMHFLNNTAINVERAPLYFDLPGQTSGPGRGALVENSVFDTDAAVFEQVGAMTDLVVNYSHLPSAEFDRGEGNRFGRPHVGSSNEDYRLLTGSPAIGTGRHSTDMGARAPTVSITGIPSPITARDDASLIISGPAITHYRYRLNNGAWSSDRPIEQPILLTNLAPGSYTVSVVGRNRMGQWQTEQDAAVSDSWVVDPQARSQVRINEVLAHNVAASEVLGRYPDAIELYNDGTAALDLSGYSLSDQRDNPRRFIFPSGSRIDAGQYLILWAGDDVPLDNQPDFGLAQEGDHLYLFAADGELIDQVEFGHQLADRSIGVIDRHGRWGLAQPTLGAPNIAASVGDPSHVRINEWYANGEIRLTDDFIELHNNQSVPVSLGGLWLTDEPYAFPRQSQIRPLSYIDAGGYVTFVADGNPQAGPHHLPFRLAADHEHLALRKDDETIIDQVFYFPQTSEFSQGRVPDSGLQFEFQSLPSPDVSNARGAVPSIPVLSFTWDSTWLYEASGNDLGRDWIEPEYDDSAWLSGPGLLGNENEALPERLRTSFSLGDITYYFRKHINIDTDPATLEVQFETIIDDGAIVYVNGQEVQRIGFDGGAVAFDRVADRNINEAALEGPFRIAGDVFVRGENVIAVEVHQVRTGSTDLVFGMNLTASSSSLPHDEINRQRLLAGLRITEIMYNPAGDDALEFIELQNTSDQAIDLAGVRLQGGVEFTFPPTQLEPGERAVVAENVERLLQAYGSGIRVVGQYRGDLANGSDELILRLPDPFEAAILRFEYDATWQPLTDGGGFSLEVVDTSTPFTDWGAESHWRSSLTRGGSPGHDGPVVPLGDEIVFNEIISHTDPPMTDTIELFNRSGASVDVGGWFISDREDRFDKFRIPDGTTIPANGYLVFDESDFNRTGGASPNDFALDGARGEQLWLWKANRDSHVEYLVDSVRIGATANAEAWGRAPNGVGEFTPLIRPSMGSANPQARVGPLVLSEVHYHPPAPSASALQIKPDLTANDLEFVEVFNPTNQTVDLTNWRIRRGIAFDFPQGTTLAAGDTLLVVSFDPQSPANATRLAAFRTEFQLPPTAFIVGGYTGTLNNGGETIHLLRPDEPPIEDPNFIPALREDAVRYDDTGDWPTTADGQGQSLARRFPAQLGHEPTSWRGEIPSPGSVNGFVKPGDFDDNGTVDQVDLQLLCSGVQARDPRFDLNADGTANLEDLALLVQDILRTSVGDANLDGRFNSSDLIEVFRAGEYDDAIARNSTWAEGDWNCDGEFDSADIVAAFQAGGYTAALLDSRINRFSDLHDAMLRDIAAAMPNMNEVKLQRAARR